MRELWRPRIERDGWKRLGLLRIGSDYLGLVRIGSLRSEAKRGCSKVIRGLLLSGNMWNYVELRGTASAERKQKSGKQKRERRMREEGVIKIRIQGEGGATRKEGLEVQQYNKPMIAG